MIFIALRTERALLVFLFEERSRQFKSSTLWSQLKATIIVNDNVDKHKYSKLIAFLEEFN